MYLSSVRVKNYYDITKHKRFIHRGGQHMARGPDSAHQAKTSGPQRAFKLKNQLMQEKQVSHFKNNIFACESTVLTG